VINSAPGAPPSARKMIREDLRVPQRLPLETRQPRR
jgi:hypothetical protein